MAATHDNDWERALARLARQMEYPATPDVAATVAASVAQRPAALQAGEQGRKGAAVGGRPSAVIWPGPSSPSPSSPPS